MSKFCPMCNEVTNCTDNCNSCLEEERLRSKFQIGDKVYASDWFYGEIVRINGDFADVEFEYGNGGGCLQFRLDELKLEEETKCQNTQNLKPNNKPR